MTTSLVLVPGTFLLAQPLVADAFELSTDAFTHVAANISGAFSAAVQRSSRGEIRCAIVAGSVREPAGSTVSLWQQLGVASHVDITGGVLKPALAGLAEHLIVQSVPEIDAASASYYEDLTRASYRGKYGVKLVSYLADEQPETVLERALREADVVIVVANGPCALSRPGPALALPYAMTVSESLTAWLRGEGEIAECDEEFVSASRWDSYPVMMALNAVMTRTDLGSKAWENVFTWHPRGVSYHTAFVPQLHLMDPSMDRILAGS